MCLALLLAYYSFAVSLLSVRGHIPAYETTPANKIDQYCALAETCVHDTIPICGKNGESERTFLDLCDLLEFACDTGDIYMHADDKPGCPLRKQKPKSNL